MDSKRVKIAFVCYGNACRSPMAESLLRHYGKENFEAYSAGVSPLGFIPHQVTEVLEERKLDSSLLSSKGFSKLPLDLDYVVSLLGESVLPLIAPLFNGPEIIWDIPDPYGGDLNAYEDTFNILLEKIDLIVQRGSI